MTSSRHPEGQGGRRNPRQLQIDRSNKLCPIDLTAVESLRIPNQALASGPIGRLLSIAPSVTSSLPLCYIFLHFLLLIRLMLSRNIATTLRPVLNQHTRTQFTTRAFTTSLLKMVKAGDSLPNVDLTEGSPGNKVNLHSSLTGKGLIIGVPAAFSEFNFTIFMPLTASLGFSNATCYAAQQPHYTRPSGANAN